MVREAAAGVYSMLQVLEENLGKPAAEALAAMLHEMLAEEKRDVVARIDEKVIARYADIQRRSHEDIAGLEIRLTKQMSDLRVELRKELADAKHTFLVWLVTALVIQSGFMVVIAWASKHIL